MRSDTLPVLDRGWEAMRFVTRDLPGPLVTRYVQQMQDIEESLLHVASSDVVSAEGLQAFCEASIEPRIQQILRSVQELRTSLG